MRTAKAIFISIAVLEGLELQLAGVTGRNIAADFGLSYHILGLFFSASTVGLLFGALAGGWLADRLGRWVVLTASVFLFGFCTIATGLAWDATSLIVLRGITGIGLGSALPSLLALVADNAPAQKEKHDLAILYSGVPIGGICASLMAMGLGDAWRAIFIYAGLIPIIIATLMLVMARSSNLQLKNRAKTAEVVPVLHVYFGEGRATASVLLWASFVATLIILYLIYNWLPILLAQQNFTPGQALGGQFLFNLGGFLACILISSHLDTKRAPAIAFLSFLSLPLFLYAMSAVAGNWIVILLSGFLGAATLATQSILYGIAPTLYPSHMRSTGSGAAVAWGRIGSIMGPYLGAILISQQGGQDNVLIGTAAVAVLAGGISLTLILHIAKNKI